MRFKLCRIFFCLSTLFKLFLVYKFFYGSSIESLDEVKERMSVRKDLLKKECTRYNILPEVDSPRYRIKNHPPAPQYSVFYFQREKSLAYCPVYKAASTSVLHWLLGMKGIGTSEIQQSKQQISDIARKSYPSIDYPIADQVLRESKVRLMIVRHPFERLVSAYRDKLSNSTINREHGTLHFYEKYGRKIVKKYRTDPSIKQLEPTFKEFVDYLIDTNLALYADDHWIPYYLFCTPCLVDYDIVIHFETIQSDFKLLLETMGDAVGMVGPEWKHITTGGRSNDNLLKTYFNQLSKSSIVKLHRKYELDFELFGYKVDDYLAMAL